MADENEKDGIDENAGDAEQDAIHGAEDNLAADESAASTVEKGPDAANDAGGSIKEAAAGLIDKAEDAGDKVKDAAADAVEVVQDAATEKVGDAVSGVKDAFDGDGDSGGALRWLLPLLLLGLLIVLGFMFCSKPNTGPAGNSNEAPAAMSSETSSSVVRV